MQGADDSVAQQCDLKSVVGERPGVLDGHVASGGDGFGVQCAAGQCCFSPVEPPRQWRHTTGGQSRAEDLAVLDLQCRRHRHDRKFE